MKCKNKKCCNEAVDGILLCQFHREQKAAWNLKYDEENREKRAEYQRNYRKQNPEKVKALNQKKDKIKKREYNKKYRVENLEQLKEYQRKTHQKNYSLNKKFINERNKQWYMANKEKSCDKTARYRARKIAAFVADVDRLIIFERDNWICQLCFKPIDRDAPPKHPMSPSIDHIIALDTGGTHEPDNVQCAHLVCNITRNRKSVTRHLEIQLEKMGVCI